MPEFNGAVPDDKRRRIVDLVERLVASAIDRREVPGREYVLEPGDDIVLVEARYELDGGNIRLGLSRPEYRPPFEWVAEITCELGDSDYFRHYLVRDDDIVLALRRDLKTIDEPEADRIIADLELVANAT